MAKRQVRIKGSELLTRQSEFLNEYCSVVFSDKRSYFLKTIKLDHTTFEARNMRNQKLSFPFQDIEEIIVESKV